MQDERPNGEDDEHDGSSGEQPASAPTRGGSNVPNAGRDADEDRTE